MQYITQTGDTLDTIAYNEYGDEEFVSVIIEANPKAAETAVFDYGTVLELPEVEKTDDSVYLPPWRTSE